MSKQLAQEIKAFAARNELAMHDAYALLGTHQVTVSKWNTGKCEAYKSTKKRLRKAMREYRPPLTLSRKNVKTWKRPTQQDEVCQDFDEPSDGFIHFVIDIAMPFIFGVISGIFICGLFS